MPVNTRRERVRLLWHAEEQQRQQQREEEEAQRRREQNAGRYGPPDDQGFSLVLPRRRACRPSSSAVGSSRKYQRLDSSASEGDRAVGGCGSDTSAASLEQRVSAVEEQNALLQQQLHAQQQQMRGEVRRRELAEQSVTGLRQQLEARDAAHAAFAAQHAQQQTQHAADREALMASHDALRAQLHALQQQLVSHGEQHAAMQRNSSMQHEQQAAPPSGVAAPPASGAAAAAAHARAADSRKTPAEPPAATAEPEAKRRQTAHAAVSAAAAVSQPQQTQPSAAAAASAVAAGSQPGQPRQPSPQAPHRAGGGGQPQQRQEQAAPAAAPTGEAAAGGTPGRRPGGGGGKRPSRPAHRGADMVAQAAIHKTFTIVGAAVAGLVKGGAAGMCGRVMQFLSDGLKEGGGPQMEWEVVDAVRRGPAAAPWVWFEVAKLSQADCLIERRCALRGTATSIFEVLSPEEQGQHALLWPLFQAAKAAGKRAQFRRAALFVEGKLVKPAAA